MAEDIVHDEGKGPHSGGIVDASEKALSRALLAFRIASIISIERGVM